MTRKLTLNLILASILQLGACGKSPMRGSKISDIVSPLPGPVKLLKSNLPLSLRLKALWTSYGYQENQNCLQYVENLKSDGTKFDTVEFFQGPCQMYPNQSVPLMRMRLRKDNSATEGYHWLIPFEINAKKTDSVVPVGNVQFEGSTPKLMTFCDLDLASNCDLSMTADGKIRAVSLKSGSSWIQQSTLNFVNDSRAARSEPNACEVEMAYEFILSFTTQAPYPDYGSMILMLKYQSDLSNTSFDSNLSMLTQCALNKYNL